MYAVFLRPYSLLTFLLRGFLLKEGVETMNIYLLRHGETDENKSRNYYGKLDAELNDTGRKQSERAGILIRGIKFDQVYISERKRTRETAEIVLSTKGLKIETDSRINEINFGVFEGKSYEEIKREYPLECEAWDKDWKGFAPGGGESYLQFYSRVREFFEDVINMDYKNILIVTHGGVIRTILCYVLGENLDLYWKFSSQNCDLSIIKYEFGNLFIDSIRHI